jgi:hypothetical protein
MWSMSKKKIGRNDRCWCGSGKKYKHCHLNRDKEESVPEWQADKEFRAAFSSKTCSAPKEWHESCSGTIVRAHTVPKSSSLKAIARDGHVYGYVPNLKKLREQGGVLAPELVGVNRASTFTGFCSTHDNSIFAPIETRPFEGSVDQLFTLAYRSFSREAYTKAAAADVTELYKQMDKGRKPEDQMEVQMLAFLNEIGVGAGMRDNAHYEEIFHKALVAGDFSSARGFVLCYPNPPPIMCSASFFPEQDFHGNVLQDLMDLENTPELLSVSSFYDGRTGLVAFAWLGDDSEICRAFINSLRGLDESAQTSALIRMFFEHIENVHISPDWWEALTEEQRSALNRRMAESANPMADRPQATLTDDCVDFEPWVPSGLIVDGPL